MYLWKREVWGPKQQGKPLSQTSDAGSLGVPLAFHCLETSALFGHKCDLLNDHKDGN